MRILLLLTLVTAISTQATEHSEFQPKPKPEITVTRYSEYADSKFIDAVLKIGTHTETIQVQYISGAITGNRLPYYCCSRTKWVDKGRKCLPTKITYDGKARRTFEALDRLPEAGIFRAGQVIRKTGLVFTTSRWRKSHLP